MIDHRTAGERLETTEAIDRLARPAHRLASRLLPRGPAKDALHGVWLGHPLHPLLTDLPIGFWTSAFALDLVGGRRAQPAADALVGLGVAGALPTAAAGVADWPELNEPERRTARCTRPPIWLQPASTRSRTWPAVAASVVDGCLRCPWHGSTFRTADGTVVRGPATAPQPASEVRVDADQLQARRRQPS